MKSICLKCVYFRLLINKSDNLSFERIINVPKRGFGPAFLKKLNLIANEKKISLYDSLDVFLEKEKITETIKKNIKNFLNVFNKHFEMLKNQNQKSKIMTHKLRVHQCVLQMLLFSETQTIHHMKFIT